MFIESLILKISVWVCLSLLHKLYYHNFHIRLCTHVHTHTTDTYVGYCYNPKQDGTIADFICAEKIRRTRSVWFMHVCHRGVAY